MVDSPRGGRGGGGGRGTSFTAVSWIRFTRGGITRVAAARWSTVSGTAEGGTSISFQARGIPPVSVRMIGKLMFPTTSRKMEFNAGSSAAWNVETAKNRASTEQRFWVSALRREVRELECRTRAALSGTT